ncbi:MAG: hypothetical protein AB7I04_03085 [Pseudomonadales bacterium]
MRYLAQLLVPALIVVAVVYLLANTKRGQDESRDGGNGSDSGTFVLILVVGATVAVLSFFLMQALLTE